MGEIISKPLTFLPLIALKCCMVSHVVVVSYTQQAYKSIMSFDEDHQTRKWDRYKRSHYLSLQQKAKYLSLFLIDSYN